MSSVEPPPDLLLDGSLKLYQRAGGHRAGTDALLLAAASPPLPAGLAVDVGAGSGAAGLAVALANASARVVLLEKNPLAAEDARRNVAVNALTERVSVFEADLFDFSARKARQLVEAADLVLTNPPFLDARNARVSPDADRAMAHVFEDGGLDKWLRASLALLKPGGRFVLIHRADALDEIVGAIAGRLGALEILPIFPRADRAAIRIVLRGRKGSKAPLSLLPGFVLHGADGKFTPPAEELHRRGRRLFAGN